MSPDKLLLFICATAVIPARASEAQPFTLGTIVVTADANQPTVDTIASRIDAGTIRKMERLDLAEALHLSPGVTMSNTGPRNEAGVSVRGFDLRQVPIFSDGIPVYVPYDGYVDLRRFTTSDVAEIRVSKGFSSALYGPNTLGGAINIISRKPQRPLEGDMLAGWVQEGGYQAGLNVGTKQSLWYAQLGGSYLNVDTYPLSKDYVANGRENGDTRDNAYRQDWRISAKLGFTPNETDEYALGYIRQRGQKGNPIYTGSDPANRVRYWQWPNWDKQTVYFIGHTQLDTDTYVKTRAYWDQFQNTLAGYTNRSYTTPATGFPSFYDDYTIGGSLEFGTRLTKSNTIKAAFHGKLDHHDEHNAGAPNYVFEETTWSFGLEDTQQFGDKWSLVTGFSMDRREVQEAVNTNNGIPFGSETHNSFNPQACLFYELTETQRLHASVTRKSRYPTIKDRYSFRMSAAVANPDLKPESAVHFELGYEGDPREHLTLRANLFAAEIEDTIQRVDNVVGNKYQFQNVGKSRHLGTELGLDWKPTDAFQWTANYTYLDRKNEGQPNIKLIDTPRHAFLTYADIRPLPWMSILPSVEYNASRWSTTYGVESGAWAITSLKFAFRLPHQVTLSTGVNNIFDRNYALTEGFPEAGRTFFMNVQYEF